MSIVLFIRHTIFDIESLGKFFHGSITQKNFIKHDGLFDFFMLSRTAESAIYWITVAT